MNDRENNKISATIDLLSNIINSRVSLTTHREIAAWTISIFYISALLSVFKYFYEKICLSNTEIILLIAIILFFLFVVICFIHSQYGSHVSSRSEYNICVKIIFQLINNDIQLRKENCKIRMGTYYPIFIQDEINLEMREIHKLVKIGPWVIYNWFFKRIVSCIFMRLFNNNSKIYKYSQEVYLNIKDIKKAQLIESSLYNLVILPTLIELIILICLLIN